MKTLNNEVFVNRNEIFTLDRIIQNKDGSPYIISKRLQNPYFLIAVSNSRYEQEKRYLYNKWLDLTNFVRFNNTTPVNLASIDNGAGEHPYTSWDNVTLLEDGAVVRGYINGEPITSYIYDDVFYLEEDGKKVYKYWSPITNRMEIYNCRIVTTFLQEITKDWVEQNYVYSITLVAGVTTREYLINLCTLNKITYTDKDTNREIYDKLIANNIKFDKDFNVDRALSVYNAVYPILTPTKLTVASDIQGGL